MLKQIKKIENQSSILFIPLNQKEITSYIKNTFKNIVIINNKVSFDKLLQEINLYDIERIYLWGYDSFYHYLLPRLKKEIEVCWIFNHTFSNLCDYNIREQLHYIFEYYDRKLINCIGCLNDDNKEIFSNAGYECENIIIVNNYESIKYRKSNTIGLLGNDFDPTNNIHNQLAALTFVNYDYCKINYLMENTKKFLDFFNIKYKKTSNIEETLENNFVNLYINFTNTNIELVKKSFSLGIPCIVGNTKLFSQSKYLKENLVLKSDDDINEIVEKIEFVRNNREKIISEYNKINSL